MATVELAWDQYEPTAGAFSQTYVRTTTERMGEFRKKGFRIVLDLGVQYPPAWVRKIEGAQYRNQYGAAYEAREPGANGVNAVFCAKVRETQERYVAHALKEFGAECAVVRLGWGFSGELNYPSFKFGDQPNCYWGFDAIAQGAAPGLPKGVAACPVPGWKPGEASADHARARQFAEWYMASLQNYHDWQIDTVRKAGYPGKLALLYPSWGIRPGQLEAAVKNNLAGTTPPEKNGEVSRGFDFARYIDGIHDPDVIVYCTWMDSDPKFSDDQGDVPARWSPAHWLASLALRHKPPLDAWGENTGRGDVAAMKLTLERARTYHMLGAMWAFEPDLFDGRRATLSDLARLLQQQKKP